ncbi:MAG TPA: DUF1641 domain-containing protein [Bacteroidales bacterium]|nr:DUF1641 domain-containing protein [Bacteroidales bacterium]
MSDTLALQQQINDINRKLDILLDYMHEQKLKTTVVDDLISDISIVGKDIYDTTVTELETRQVQLDPEEVKLLAIKLVKNVPTFVQMIDMLESMTDLIKDATPMVNELIIDFTRRLNEFEEKGYFEFARETGHLIDKVVTNYSPEDIRNLSDNVVEVLDIVRNLSHPAMLKSVNHALKVFNRMDAENVPDYSLLKLMREMNSPEMRRGMTFMVTFMKNLAKG